MSKSEIEIHQESESAYLDIFFNPKSVAIVGASRDETKFSRVILNNLQKLG